MIAVPNSAGAARPRLPAPDGACDSHIHVYDPRFPLVHPRHRATSDAGAGEYALLQRRLGTSRVVVVQAAAYGTDNRATLAAVQALGPREARAIGVLHPDVSDAQLQRLDEGGMRGLRFTQHDPSTAVTTADMIEPLARRIHELGWHVQLHLRADQIVAMSATIERLPGTIVFDHLGRLPQPQGAGHPAFGFIARLLGEGRAWVKLSGAYLDTKVGPPGYDDVSRLAREYARIAPDRLVWGSDWPHPTETTAKPDDAALFDLLGDWAGDEGLRRRILVDNARTLYGF